MPPLEKSPDELAYFVEEVLVKNCRFEVYESKLTSIALARYEAKDVEELDDLQIKQRIGGILSSLNTYCYE